MSPELAARVEAAVTGRPVGAKKLPPTLVAILRTGGFVGVIAFVVWIIVARRQAIDELQGERDALLAEVQGHASKVTDADKAMVSRVESWLPKHSGPYEGDL